MAVLISVCAFWHFWSAWVSLKVFFRFVDTCCFEEFTLQEYCALWFKTRKCTTSISRTIPSSEWRLNNTFHCYSLVFFLKQYWHCCLKSDLLWDFQLTCQMTWTACIVVVSFFFLLSLSAFSALIALSYTLRRAYWLGVMCWTWSGSFYLHKCLLCSS